MNNMYQNIWNSDFFGYVAMTEAIIKTQYVPTDFETLVPWKLDSCTTDEFALDVSAGRVQTLPIVSRSGDLPTLSREARGVEKFPLMRWGQEEDILNSAIRGVRDTGTVNLRTLESVRQTALSQIVDNINKTNNWHMSRALDGLVQDPSDGKVFLNTHVKMKTRQAYFEWDFSDVKLDPATLLKGIKRFISRKLGMANLNATSLILACGDRFYVALMALPTVQELYKSWSAITAGKRWMASDIDTPVEFVLADTVKVRNLGQARIDGGANGFIDDDCAYVVPIVQGMYRVMVGPSDLAQFENNPLPYYAVQGPLGRPGFETGITVRGETIRIYYVTRADAIVKIEGLNIANDNAFAEPQYYDAA